LQHGDRRVAHHAAAAALQCGTQFDLAALEAVREQLAQRRLVRAQLVGQAQVRSRKRLLTERRSSTMPGRAACASTAFWG
jgi:hypothetical protein